MGAVRTLPIRVAPLPGEAIDSWLHASAARMGVSWADFLASVGLARPHFGLDTWVVQPLPQEIASIAAATDLDPACVASMTLSHYAGRVLQINTATRRVTGPAPWCGVGSPYCPQCLRDGGTVALAVANGLVVRLCQTPLPARPYLPDLRAQVGTRSRVGCRHPRARMLREPTARNGDRDRPALRRRPEDRRCPGLAGTPPRADCATPR